MEIEKEMDWLEAEVLEAFEGLTVGGLHLRHIIPASDISIIWERCFGRTYGDEVEGCHPLALTLLDHLIVADEDRVLLRRFMYCHRCLLGHGSGLFLQRKLAGLLRGLRGRIANSPRNLFHSDANENVAIGNRPDFGEEVRGLAQVPPGYYPNLHELQRAWCELFDYLGLNPKLKAHPSQDGEKWYVWEHDESRSFKPWLARKAERGNRNFTMLEKPELVDHVDEGKPARDLSAAAATSASMAFSPSSVPDDQGLPCIFCDDDASSSSSSSSRSSSRRH